jgi:hypothetical protein
MGNEDGGRALSLAHRRDEGRDIATSFWAIRGPRPPWDPDPVQAIQGCYILQGVQRKVPVRGAVLQCRLPSIPLFDLALLMGKADVARQPYLGQKQLWRAGPSS